MNNELWLNEAMLKFEKKFYKGGLNIINAPAGSGKSKFIFSEFLKESYKYVDHLKETKKCYNTDLNKVLYVCDTSMLKSSILEETKNEGITKILEQGDLIEAMKDKTSEQIMNGDIGHIKVITYSTFGWLLQQPAVEHIILNYIDVILMDEMQNLFKYAFIFDNNKNKKPYGTVINYLPTLLNDKLVIAVSATPRRIHHGVEKLGVMSHTIFNLQEIEQIKKYYSRNISKTNNIWNQLKSLALNYNSFKKTNTKIMIYTNTIRQSEKFKMFLENAGYKTEWLCSINNEIENEFKEMIPRMNRCQQEIRQKLIEKGTLPDDLDIIIVNSGYETGWNLRDERLQYAYIDSTDEEVQIQARNRIRHDIEFLCIKVVTDSYGRILEKGRYMDYYPTDESVGIPLLARKIEDKYIGVKLTPENKRYLVNRYAAYWWDEDTVNWQTFKRDLDETGFIVNTDSHGTFIFKKEEFENIQRNKKGVIKMEKLFINWMESEWDKTRITCQDVIDCLDIGIKSFNKLIKTEIILSYFKEHRYTISKVNKGRTYYLGKY